MELPIYEMVIGDGNGVDWISLVREPATMIGFQLYSGHDELVKFAVSDVEERKVTGVVMMPDTLIYRRNGDYEYNVFYSKATIEEMSVKMFQTGAFHYVDTEHQNDMQIGIEVMELFIKDSAKGIVPKGFEGIPDGSLMVTYHVTNDMVWNACKSGVFTGFSLEGWFEPVERQALSAQRNKSTIKNMFKTLKEKLAAILSEYAAIKTENGDLNYEGDTLEVGTPVYSEDGNPAADGEYRDGDTVYVVKDGKIEEIKTAEETDEEPKEEVEGAEENAEETDGEGNTDYQAQIDALKAEIEALKTAISEIKDAVSKIPSKPVEEEFSEIKNRKGNKAAEAIRSLRN